MLNTFDFPEGKTLAKRSLPVAKAIAKLKERCRRHRIPIVYVNDNFGLWQADWKTIFEQCTEDDSPGRLIAKTLRPSADDLFVLKPKHSGFYCTNLEPLLRDLGVSKLILTGIAGDICVLFTAHDAHMREFDLAIPRDCVACNTTQGDRFLQHQLKATLKFPTPLSSQLRL